jgi:hypothetical protein
MDMNENTVKVYIGDPEDGLTIDTAIALAPDTWDSFYLGVHEHGYTFVSYKGIRYLLHTGENGWIDYADGTQGPSPIYDQLGHQIVQLYIERNQS